MVRTSQLTIECVAFGGLQEAIRVACGAGADWSSPQIDYLQSYLRGDPRAKTLIIEKPYVDRHYLEEYSAYYFSAFRNGGSTTTRIHLFSETFDRAKLSEWIQQAASGDPTRRREIASNLDGAYLGFITVRPIPSAPIGRTILRPYEDKAARSYIPSEGGHAVHLMGIELTARGLPFQQQDQAVGACATTAVWSAMSRVVRADGGRAPTPYAITLAATRHYLQDRALPAVSGLELAQLTAAVRELGYAPYVLKPAQEHATFALTLKCYLRSGIPAVLVLEDTDGGGYHAVTASGYRLGDDEEPATDIAVELHEGNGRLCSRGINRIYVHDDRFGPYVRMQLKPPPDHDGDTVLERIGHGPQDPAQGAGGKVCYALFPLYPKLRLTARELIGLGIDMLPVIRSILSPEERAVLNVEVFFVHGGRYQTQLLALGLEDPGRVERFLAEIALPRYVGIVRFCLDDAALVDVICDTTDIRRDYPRRAPVLAVFPFAGTHVATFARAVTSMAPWSMVV